MAPNELQNGAQWAKNGVQGGFSRFQVFIFRFFVKPLPIWLLSFILSHFYKSSLNLLLEIYLLVLYMSKKWLNIDMEMDLNFAAL